MDAEDRVEASRAIRTISLLTEEDILLPVGCSDMPDFYANALQSALCIVMQ